MPHIISEIKARSTHHSEIRRMLDTLGARFAGLDHQVDTYFRVGYGRMKLREGEIENNLIFYERDDIKGPKQSNVTLYRTEPYSTLKGILSQALGIRAVVDKYREIYYLENVKIHLDTVENLGTFVEIEAIDLDGSIGQTKLTAQCQYYLKLFQINQADLVEHSYSDLLLAKP